MPKLFQINICSAALSTGKITEDIAKVAINHGWDCYIAWGRFAKPSVCKQIRIGNKLNTYIHYIAHKFFDMEGLVSRNATYELIKTINEIKPDIIHLHNIHDHYLNYPLLFEYLANNNIPVVWTLHDFWTFTGGCTYFDIYDCNNWKIQCTKCPQHRALFNDNTEKQYMLKKDLLSKLEKIVYVPVSHWLASYVSESYQGYRPIITIHNGIDLNIFKPTKSKVKEGRFRIIGVASVWSERKGLKDFIKLRSMLSMEYEILIIGLNKKQIDSLPTGIIGVSRTTNIKQLVDYYSEADVFVNPTYSDNFPTTNIEALACGTPVITYCTGGSPEAIDSKTGIVIERGNIKALVEAIKYLRNFPLSTIDCRNRAENLFNKDNCFVKYIEIYNSLL